MKKFNVEKKWVFEPLNKVVIENHLAKLFIHTGEGREVYMEGEVNFKNPQNDFMMDDYILSEYRDGVLKLILQEIASEDVKNVVITITIPEDVFLDLESENDPVNMDNLKIGIKVLSENGPVSVQNCQGDIHLENENGMIRLNNCQGNIFARLENGPLSAANISGNTLHLEGENGPLKIRLSTYPNVEISSENGSVYFETTPVEEGDFLLKSQNGSINLILPNDFDFALEAKTQFGRIKSTLDLPVTVENDAYVIINGDGATKIKAITENGIIKINSDTHLNLDFVKNKFEQIRIALLNVNTEEEKQKVVDMVNKVADYINRIASSFKEDIIKEKITSATNKLKDLVANFDFRETNDKVLKNLEEIGSQIQDALKEGVKNLKESMYDLKKHHFHTESVTAYIKKILDSPQIKPYLGGEHKKKEKESSIDHSRMKILEMLEAGKITAEEAERLLKAIGKE